MGGREIQSSDFQYSKTFFTVADNLEEAIINLSNIKKYYSKQKYYDVKEVELFKKEVEYFRYRF